MIWGSFLCPKLNGIPKQAWTVLFMDTNMAQVKTNEKLMKVLTTHTKMYHTRAMFGSQITENGYTVLKNGISQSMNCKLLFIDTNMAAAMPGEN